MTLEIQKRGELDVIRLPERVMLANAPAVRAVDRRGGGTGWRAMDSRRGPARRRASPATGEWSLPPNEPPFPYGEAGGPPGSHHDASGSR